MMRTLAFVLLAGILAGAPCAQTRLKTELVASGLDRPLYLASPPAGRRLFVVEQTGKIRIVEDGKLLATPFLDVSSRIFYGGENGLLCLTFHPDYATNGFFYVFWTRKADEQIEVHRFTVSASDRNVADPTSGKRILGPIAKTTGLHNGGCMHFGPKGYLWIAVGDGGAALTRCHAQDLGRLAGKILRIDVAGGDPYEIPSDNPFVSRTGARGEIWAYGLRNPWRFSLDRKTGDRWIADVGEGEREEINFEPASSTGGKNYGWNIVEGTVCTSTPFCKPACTDPGFTAPIYEYSHTQGRCITGGFVYRGCAIPDLRGTYFFADFARARVWSFRRSGSIISDFVERTAELAPGNNLTIDRITSFGEDACGELHILDFGGGEVFKIVPDAPPPVIDLGFGKPRNNKPAPEFTACGLLTRGNRAEFRLTGTAANSVAILALGLHKMPYEVWGGTVVPFPVQLIHYPTDSNGRVAFVVPGGGGVLTVYAQFGILDPESSFGVGYSNALEIRFQN